MYYIKSFIDAAIGFLLLTTFMAAGIFIMSFAATVVMS